MADLANDAETQLLDNPSLSSPSSSENELKNGNENEYQRFQNTVPFDDTVVLDVDTEMLDSLNCVGNMRTQSADEYEEEVVLDSDDEGRIRSPEVVGAAKGLSFDENGRRVQGDALYLEKRQLCPPCGQDKDGASAGKHWGLGYSRRVSSSVHAHLLAAHSMTCKGNDNRSSFIQTHTQSQIQLVLKDDGISREQDQYLVDTDLKEVVQDHDNWEGSGGMKDTLVGKKGSLRKIENTDGQNGLSQPLVCDHELASLNDVGSQDTGESSQATALDFVDRFLSCNNVDLSQGVDPRKTVREKSPPVSRAKGPRSLAKRINHRTSTRKMETFEWVDNQQDEGGDFFSKRMETFFNCGGHGQRSLNRPQKVRHLVNTGGGRSSNECEEKEEFLNPSKEMMESIHSDSRFMVHNSKEVGKTSQVSEMKIERNFVKESDEQLNSESSVQQLQATGIEQDTQDMFGVFNTQMAAEVMEALSYAPLAECSNDDAYQGQQNTLEASQRGVTKDKACSEHPSFQKRASSGSGGIAKKSKQIKRPADKFNRQTSSSAQKLSKQLKELDSELKARTKEKRAKSLAENTLNCRNLANVCESSGRRSSNPVEQGKADRLLDRDNIKEVDKYVISPIIVEHTPPGRGQSQGECRGFSPVACRIRQSMSCRLSEENVPTQSYVPTQSSSSNTSAEARNSKVSQQGQTGVGVTASTSLKLDFWSYPRGKRSFRNMSGHSNVSRNLHAAITIVDGAGGSDYPIKRGKRSNRNARTSCVSLDMKRKTQSSEYSFPSWYSSENNLKGSSLMKNFDNPGSADVSNCEMALMNKRKFLQDMVTAEASPQSGKLDDLDSVRSADGARKNLTSEVSLNEEAKQTCSECTTSGSCTKGSNVAAPSYLGYAYHKQPCNKNLPRSSLIKELIQLGVPEIIPSFSSKDLRRRRDLADIRVLFSQHLDNDTIKQQKKILARLGISIASCSSEATHFIADKFVRTRNMLEAMALGKPVVTHLWLESCGQASCFIDEKNYILRDAKREKEIGFSMPVSLACANQHPLLKGHSVFITPNIKPGKEMIASLVKAVHGQAVEKIEKSAKKDEKLPDDPLILSCEEDYAICEPFLNKGAAVYSSELLLNGIVIQKLECERHQLFQKSWQEELLQHMVKERWQFVTSCN
ncbi:hypothetical protein L1049_004715 [Liquidambar formosana]|uniref:BRCT domain-containing protein n=1 Tax=Liquidambar formosana TaxID=63359 RepID=A0AAP0RTD9_LIQFO